MERKLPTIEVLETKDVKLSDLRTKKETESTFFKMWIDENKPLKEVKEFLFMSDEDVEKLLKKTIKQYRK